jgi:hypothetical protein
MGADSMLVRMGGNPQPFGVTEQLLEDEVLVPLLTCSTSLFAGRERTDPRPAYCGSATLVSTGGRRCILTAEHVWKEVKKRGNSLFFSLDQTVSASSDLPICIEDLSYVGAPLYITTPRSEEWGPDLALLAIPDLHADVAKTRKAFYDLDRRRASALSSKALHDTGLWAVIGAPGEECELGAEGWEMQTYAVGSTIVSLEERDGFDFLNLRINRDGRSRLPSKMNGLSGSGLWRCDLSRSPEGKIKAHGFALEGVAFYENREQPGFIRCHGRKSIYECALGG